MYATVRTFSRLIVSNFLWYFQLELTFKVLHSLYICDHKKIFVLLPAEDFMNNMIFDLKQSFGPLSQAKGRLLSQREIWYFTPLVSFRGKKN